MRMLRPISGDRVTTLRAPTLTGVYRFTSDANGIATNVRTIRASLTPGFDAAALSAIGHSPGTSRVFAPPDQEDSMAVEVRISTDSTPGARRVLSAYFPRMPVIDAAPSADNPAAVLPTSAKRDSISSGEIVLRFVVDRDGAPVLETLEIIRANARAFVRPAIAALPSQVFAPATIHGCAVAQRIDYPFVFDVTPAPPAARH